MLPLQKESIQVAKPGIWPWLVGLSALLALVVCVNAELRTIQDNIMSRVVSTVATSAAANVKVEVDGRDVSLTGTIAGTLNRDQFVDSIRALEGVRVVEDDMHEFNPREQARIERLEFRQRLGAIDATAIRFEPGSTSLSLSSESTLLQVAHLLKNSPDRQIKIAGHTDNSGNADKNLELSRVRAQAVADFLVARGVGEAQLFVQGFGQTRPKFDNNQPEGRAANRRIEFIFMR